MLALEQALQIIQAQDTWDVQDDQCDCTYQRIGYWNNPYIGETLEVRLCCVWGELEKQYPQFFRRTQIEPAAWNGEADMPRSIWYRQQAVVTGKPLAALREEALSAPKGKVRQPKPLFFLPWSGSYLEVELYS